MSTENDPENAPANASQQKVIASGKLGDGTNLRAVLEQAVLSAGVSNGVLRILSRDVRGHIGIQSGNLITGAHLTSSGELGRTALYQLLSANKGMYAFLSLEEPQAELVQGLNVAMEALLNWQPTDPSDDPPELRQAAEALITVTVVSEEVSAFDRSTSSDLIRQTEDEFAAWEAWGVDSTLTKLPTLGSILGTSRVRAANAGSAFSKQQPTPQVSSEAMHGIAPAAAQAPASADAPAATSAPVAAPAAASPPAPVAASAPTMGMVPPPPPPPPPPPTPPIASSPAAPPANSFTQAQAPWSEPVFTPPASSGPLAEGPAATPEATSSSAPSQWSFGPPRTSTPRPTFTTPGPQSADVAPRTHQPEITFSPPDPQWPSASPEPSQSWDASQLDAIPTPTVGSVPAPTPVPEPARTADPALTAGPVPTPREAAAPTAVPTPTPAPPTAQVPTATPAAQGFSKVAIAAVAITVCLLLVLTQQTIQALAYGSSLADGIKYLSNGNNDAAISSFSQSIQADAIDNKAYLYRAIAEARTAQSDKAIADYNKALALAPHNPDAYVGRAELHARNHRYDLAIIDCNEALKIDNRLVDVYEVRAASLNQLQRFNEAIVDSSIAISMDGTPDRLKASVFANRAYAQYRTGSYDKAIGDYSDAIQCDPQNGSYFASRALVYKQMHEGKLAKADCDQAIALRPQDANLLKVRAVCDESVNDAGSDRH